MRKPQKQQKNLPATADDKPSMSLAQICALNMPHIGDKKKPIGCIENIKFLLNILDVTIRYNVISKNLEIRIPNSSFSVDNEVGASMAWIISKMREVGMSTTHHKEFFLYLCDERQHNPVYNWITGKSWDGESRLQEFFDTIEAGNKEAKEVFMYRWLIGAVAAACTPNGIDSNGVLVLQGPQGIGKTWWFRKLVPQDKLPNVTRADATIDPSDKDSVNQAISHWLVELGELDATFKRAEIAALKSFITRDYDMYRKPFAASDSKYPRRTVFVASVNHWHYLADDTGNRRFWTIQCIKCNSYHNLDMQQVWAEAHEKWKSGDTWRLTDAEMKLLNEVNEDHIVADPVTENIQQKLAWDADASQWEWKTSTEILEMLGMQRITKADVRLCADAVRKLNGSQTRRTGNGRQLFAPPRRTMRFKEDTHE